MNMSVNKKLTSQTRGRLTLLMAILGMVLLNMCDHEIGYLVRASFTSYRRIDVGRFHARA